MSGREHGPDCPCPSRQHHPDRYSPDGGMRQVADPGGPDCLTPRARLDALRARAAARLAKYPWHSDDPARGD